MNHNFTTSFPSLILLKVRVLRLRSRSHWYNAVALLTASSLGKQRCYGHEVSPHIFACVARHWALSPRLFVSVEVQYCATGLASAKCNGKGVERDKAELFTPPYFHDEVILWKVSHDLVMVSVYLYLCMRLDLIMFCFCRYWCVFCSQLVSCYLCLEYGTWICQGGRRISSYLRVVEVE